MAWDPGRELILRVRSEAGESIQRVSLTQGSLAWKGSTYDSRETRYQV